MMAWMWRNWNPSGEAAKENNMVILQKKLNINILNINLIQM